MTGWQIGAAVVGAFTVGYVLASWFSLIRYEETIVHWSRRALDAEANTDHSRCRTTAYVQARFIAEQEALLDTYRAGKTTGEQAEAWLSEQDGAT